MYDLRILKETILLYLFMIAMSMLLWIYPHYLWNHSHILTTYRGKVNNKFSQLITSGKEGKKDRGSLTVYNFFVKSLSKPDKMLSSDS